MIYHNGYDLHHPWASAFTEYGERMLEALDREMVEAHICSASLHIICDPSLPDNVVEVRGVDGSWYRMVGEV